MTVDEAKIAILNVLKGLELVNEEKAGSVTNGREDVEFSALNIDSVSVVDLCVGLEERIGREVTIEELVENPTVNQLADHFARASV